MEDDRFTRCVKNRLEHFRRSPANRGWLYFPGIKVYVKKSRRVLTEENKLLRCFDIVGIEADNPGCGVFTRLLKIIEESARKYPVDAIFVENVLDERFMSFFKRKGYEEARNAPCSVFKLAGQVSDISMRREEI